MTSDLQLLGKTLRQARERAGMSQRETAEAANISPTYVRALEVSSNPNTKKASRPSAAVLRAVAAALGTDADTLLELAGYEKAASKLARPAMEAPARNTVEGGLKRMRDASKRLHHRSPFIYAQTVERFAQFTAEFLTMADGCLRCTAEEEPYLTRLAYRQCRSSVRAISYQDEKWWLGRRGREYLRLHAEVRKKGIEITRIFLVPQDLQNSLRETFEKHVELGIRSFVLSPDDVDDTLCRDFVIFDEDLLRTGDPLGFDTDRKKAEFIDNPVEIAQALVDFRRLHDIASNLPSETETIIAQLD